MRTIKMHQINGLNQELEIDVMDEPAFGGASHHYKVHPKDTVGLDTDLDVRFQRGPIKEHGVNGVSHEALLAILIDRLRGFQSGDYSCRENAIALTKLEEALHWLNARTSARMSRGVEGTSAA